MDGGKDGKCSRYVTLHFHFSDIRRESSQEEAFRLFGAIEHEDISARRADIEIDAG